MTLVVTLTVWVCVNFGDSVPRSTTSGSLSRGVILAFGGRVNVHFSVPWSIAKGSVSLGVTWQTEAGSTIVMVFRGALLVRRCPLE